MNIEIKTVKIIVTIPVENLDDVRNAICEVGAGIIGNYTDCSIATKCIGTFKPIEGANPYIGEKNKLEVRCSIDKVKEVISKLREIQLYEEPAIDIIPLIDESCFK